MVDEHKPAVLRGFDIAVADIGDELHLCHPLLSFEGNDTLYVARRLDWQNDRRKALAVADPSEASDLGTLLPDTHEQAIASGEAVIVVGTGSVQAAKAAGVQLDDSEMAFARVRDAECRIGIATPASFEKLKTRLTAEAWTVFDEALGDAARRKRRLSERGNAALLLLRRCGPRRRDDLAIRQLAGARQNHELDLYRRLLMRFALELDTQQSDLDKKAERHIALASKPRAYTTTLDLSPRQKYRNLFKLYADAITSSKELHIYSSKEIPSTHLKKYQQFSLSRKMSVESLRSDVQRAERWRNSDYITIYRALAELLKKYPVMIYIYPPSEFQNQVSTEFWKMIRAKASNDHLPGDIASIQATKDKQTKETRSFPG